MRNFGKIFTRIVLSSGLLALTLLAAQVLAGNTSGVVALALSPDASRYATGHDDTTVSVWDAATGQLLNTFPGPQFSWMTAPDRLYITDVAFSPDGQRLATTFGANIPLGFVRILDANTGQVLAEFEADAFTGAVDWSPDGSRLAVLSSSGTGASTTAYLTIWDGTGVQLNDFGLDGQSAISVDWSPDGSRIAYANGYTAVIWDATSWQEQFTLVGHEGVVTSVAWNPNGNKLATTDEYTVRIWDSATGQQQVVFQKGYVERTIPTVIWSLDGTQVASTTSTSIEAWNVENWQPTFTIDVGGHMHGPMWQPNGTLLYSSGVVRTAVPPTPTPTFTPAHSRHQ